MRGINLSPKTPLSQIALYKVPCQRKHQEKVMKGARVGKKKKKKEEKIQLQSPQSPGSKELLTSSQVSTFIHWRCI